MGMIGVDVGIEGTAKTSQAGVMRGRVAYFCYMNAARSTGSPWWWCSATSRMTGTARSGRPGPLHRHQVVVPVPSAV